MLTVRCRRCIAVPASVGIGRGHGARPPSFHRDGDGRACTTRWNLLGCSLFRSLSLRSALRSNRSGHCPGLSVRRPVGRPTVTAVAPRRVVSRPYPVQRPARGSKFLAYVNTTDPKVLGVMYIATSFTWFMIGGLMALFMRAELARPGMQFLSPGAVQPAVHHARHDHAAVLCHGRGVRVRELRAAVADRRPGRGLPAVERVLLLAVLLRRDHRERGVLHPGRRGRVRLDRVHPAVVVGELPGRRR